ncbi:MAG: hypothetical protein KDA61_21005, partial [Planctomycetales bacterium]|nr:hypothetical protein [Planctomycetales bacterium]
SAEGYEQIAGTPIVCRVVPGLDYDLPDAAASFELARGIAEELDAAGVDRSETILHWHNHALGKNASQPLAAVGLARAGFRTLLQLHDFAEDFRPQNLTRLARALTDGDVEKLPDVLYPQSPSIHYAVLNQRDRKVLAAAGVPSERLHWLPNPVMSPPVDDDPVAARARVDAALGSRPTQKLLAYPVRGIRRKNIGELLLRCAVRDDVFGYLSLKPENEVEKPSFERWVRVARELRLPCRLGDAGEHFNYSHLLAAADAVLTTSVAEGFGMAFLECWLAGKPLGGRNLPEITDDFVELGVDLTSLYERVATPIAWLDRDLHVELLGVAVQTIYAAGGEVSPSRKKIEEILDSQINEGTIDFARLPTALQTTVIELVCRDSSCRNEFASLNPDFLSEGTPGVEAVAANAKIIERELAPGKIGAQLAQSYAGLLATDACDTVERLPHGLQIRSRLWDLARLEPLRIES